jgi:hypothetical protein
MPIDLLHQRELVFVGVGGHALGDLRGHGHRAADGVDLAGDERLHGRCVVVEAADLGAFGRGLGHGHVLRRRTGHAHAQALQVGGALMGVLVAPYSTMVAAA